MKNLIALFNTGAFSLLMLLTSANAIGQTAEQVRQMTDAGVPVMLPSYVPKGFRQINFEFDIIDGTSMIDGTSRKYGEYKAIYRGPNNFCYDIEGSNHPLGAGERKIRQWVINHKSFGKVILEEAIFNGISSWLQANIFLAPPTTRYGANYFFYSPLNSNQSNCNKISPQEASKIIHSLRFLNP